MRHAHILIAALLLAAGAAAFAAGPDMPAVVHKPSVDVHTGPDFATPKVTTLARNAKVAITAQQGLWYQLKLDAGKPGYVRVNDVRMAYAGAENPDANMRALFTGNAGKGRVSETASVRGIDESDLRAAGYNGADMSRLQGYRVDAQAAAAHAAGQGWRAKQVAYAREARPGAKGSKTTQAQKRSGLSAARGLLASMGVDTGSAGDSAMRVADSAAGKSEDELAAEELALGPEIAGRVLGAAPLWQDDAAGIYLARAGFDPLALYSVLQKMTALGTRSSRMAQLYRTHRR